MLKVSIIVPIYNAEKYLSQCVESLVCQTYTNIEIILINDGSTDNSSTICEMFAQNDNRIRTIHQQNKGLSGARNAGIEVSSGDFIMFVDSDDWIESNTCEEAVKYSQTFNADIVFWSYTREYSDTALVKKVINTKNDVEIFNKSEVKFKLHRRIMGLIEDEMRYPENMDSLVTAWSKLYRRNILKNNEIEFIDTRIIGTEDALFNLYAFGFCERAVYINKELYHYRKTNLNSITKVQQADLYEKWKNLFIYMKRYIEINSLEEIYTTALNNRICLSIVGLGLNILNSNHSTRNRITLLSDILNDELYTSAYANLKLKHFDLKWRIFFFLAKYKKISLLYLMLVSISFILNKRNKLKSIENGSIKNISISDEGI
ncbi:glycosyltransferase family 2 protein [Peribacillus sp. NPDC097198]|uniref:glycosyltransferase family 2 protein n=1 Tax=Peribacillus sp. NPDC097198 TaxID=3364397 RepID=UPI003823CAE7